MDHGVDLDSPRPAYIGGTHMYIYASVGVHKTCTRPPCNRPCTFVQYSTWPCHPRRVRRRLPWSAGRRPRQAAPTTRPATWRWTDGPDGSKSPRRSQSPPFRSMAAPLRGQISLTADHPPPASSCSTRLATSTATASSKNTTQGSSAWGCLSSRGQAVCKSSSCYSSGPSRAGCTTPATSGPSSWPARSSRY